MVISRSADFTTCYTRLLYFTLLYRLEHSVLYCVGCSGHASTGRLCSSSQPESTRSAASYSASWRPAIPSRGPSTRPQARAHRQYRMGRTRSLERTSRSFERENQEVNCVKFSDFDRFCISNLQTVFTNSFSLSPNSGLRH